MRILFSHHDIFVAMANEAAHASPAMGAQVFRGLSFLSGQPGKLLDLCGMIKRAPREISIRVVRTKHSTGFISQGKNIFFALT